MGSFGFAVIWKGSFMQNIVEGYFRRTALEQSYTEELFGQKRSISLVQVRKDWLLLWIVNMVKSP